MAKIVRALLALFVFVGLLGALVFSSEVPCSGNTPDGVAWNFDALKTSSDNTFTGIQDGYKYNFHINICKDTEKKCKTDSPDSPAQQFNENNDQCVAYLGVLSQMSVTSIKNGSAHEGFALTYSGGEPASKGDRISVFKIMCDLDVDESKPEFIGETSGPLGGVVGYTYTFVWRTKWGCTEDQRPSGCNTFCIVWTLIEVFMLIGDILFIPVIIAYFVIGALLNKFALHKSGTDIIPQFRFWKNLPILIFDGMKWPIVSLVMFIKSKTSKGNYSTMK